MHPRLKQKRYCTENTAARPLEQKRLGYIRDLAGPLGSLDRPHTVPTCWAISRPDALEIRREILAAMKRTKRAQGADRIRRGTSGRREMRPRMYRRRTRMMLGGTIIRPGLKRRWVRRVQQVRRLSGPGRLVGKFKSQWER